MLVCGKLEFSGGFLLAAALLFYLDTEYLLLWAFLAGSLHELAHYTAVRLSGGRLLRLRVSLTGGTMELDQRYPLTYGGELAAILAGPAANLALALICARLGRFWEVLFLSSGINLALGVFNLLPICPLDGGRALFLILNGFLSPETARKLLWSSSLLLLSGLLSVGLFLFWHGEASITLPGMAIWLLTGLLLPSVHSFSTGVPFRPACFLRLFPSRRLRK